MAYLAVGIIAYLVGSFPTGVVISQRKYGIDVREMGSGNIGATNVTRVFGWYAGLVTFLIDFLKGFVPLVLLRNYYPNDPWLWAIAGIGLVLGHCFSAYLHLRGGKGVATGLGVFAVAAPLAALIAAVCYLVLLLVTKISAVGSLGGVVVMLGYLAWEQPAAPTWALVGIVCAVVLIRHHHNIRRLWGQYR